MIIVISAVIFFNLITMSLKLYFVHFQHHFVLGRISRHDIISSPTPNNFAAEDNANGSNRNDKNIKYDINGRKNKKSKTCNIL